MTNIMRTLWCKYSAGLKNFLVGFLCYTNSGLEYISTTDFSAKNMYLITCPLIGSISLSPASFLHKKKFIIKHID